MRDVTEPIMRACFTEIANGAVINIGPDDEFITINQLAIEIAKILDFDLDPIYMPSRPQEVKDANCSANLARNLLDYKPKTSLVDGLLELATWIKSEGPRDFDYKLPIEIISDKTPKTWTQRLI